MLFMTLTGQSSCRCCGEDSVVFVGFPTDSTMFMTLTGQSSWCCCGVNSIVFVGFPAGSTMFMTLTSQSSWRCCGVDSIVFAGFPTDSTMLTTRSGHRFTVVAMWTMLINLSRGDVGYTMFMVCTVFVGAVL